MMARLSIANRKRVIILRRLGYSITDIQRNLKEEDVVITVRSLQRLCRKFKDKHTIQDLPRSCKTRKLSPEMVALLDDMLSDNDETTARQIHSHICENFTDLDVSLATVRRVRKENGWVSTRPHYCQLIREVNKVKRTQWCQQQIDNKETFSNVVFTDECTVQLDHHGRICFRKKGKPRALKQRPKHPVKVHIWGGISNKGATRVIFTGIMNAPRYAKILEESLVPFLRKYFPEGHRLQQDNDPKHCSKYIQAFFERNNIIWWKTPAESPDLNPIENVWGSLKQFLRSTYNLNELRAGIEQFWFTLTPTVCSEYIRHLQKVMPKVIEVGGNPSGF